MEIRWAQNGAASQWKLDKVMVRTWRGVGAEERAVGGEVQNDQMAIFGNRGVGPQN